MFTPLICGSNFQDEEDDEGIEFLNLCSETKKSSRKPTRRTKDTKNPYAERGLDKFSALLAELDSKRQKIYTQKGSEDISLLGFVYSNSSDYYKPIVIRLSDKGHDRMKLKKKTENNSKVSDGGDGEKLSRIESNTTIKNARVGFLWGDVLKLSRPSYYVPVMSMMLILVFLAFFGRSFAIVCTCLGWYVIPTIKNTGGGGGGGLDMKKSSSSSSSRGIKKDYVKGLSDNENVIDGGADHGLPPSSPTSVSRQGSPPRLGHGRSS